VSGSDDRSRVERARLYVVTPARIAAGDVADLVPELGGAGVDILQLREKDAEAGDVIRDAERILAACEQAGVAFVVNDRPDIAVALGCGVHLGQNDLPIPVARRIVPDAVLGVSTHREAEIRAAVETPERIDYVVVGPVFETPTKPGRPATGLDLLSYAARRIELPWFAIGGIDAGNLPEVLDRGARRVVVVRAVTQANDPVAAAARLRELLDQSSP
jgi:thiamine-phosphate pyrophosphorylase